jgi:hypothetical protein
LSKRREPDGGFCDNGRVAMSTHFGDRYWNPLRLAFTLTFVCLLFLVSGAAGYRLQRGAPLFSETRWTGAVIWPQVNVGLVFLLGAAYCWREAIRETDRRLKRGK